MVKLVETEAMFDRIEKLLAEPPQRDPYKRFTILTYQLGGIGKSLRYSMIFHDQKDGHLLYMKTELSDLLMQTIVMAKLYNYDINELLELGLKRLDEYKKHGEYTEE